MLQSRKRINGSLVDPPDSAKILAFSILKASNSITRLLSRRQAQHAFSHLTTRGRVAVQHIPQSVCMWRLERDAGKRLVIALSNG
ncbi:hypothetical protein ROHU_015745 [Labeo rohita]|uniref:Uncharacterized protein n=1 Tax=Labeo rohita TaxID=84645 RepID=A0A498NN03_LABRO|nr:hypothetical protein ROHU_015745 [Labeo rohita]